VTRRYAIAQTVNDRGEPDRSSLDSLAADPEKVGLDLPPPFATFIASPALREAVRSGTACWRDLAEPIPSPVEDGAYLVRFLRDQQDCVMWFLYLFRLPVLDRERDLVQDLRRGGISSQLTTEQRRYLSHYEAVSDRS